MPSSKGSITAKAIYVVLTVLVAFMFSAIILVSVQALRAPTAQGVLNSINSIRTPLGLRALRLNPYLDTYAQQIADSAAVSRDERAVVSFPALDSRYPTLRFQSYQFDTDVLPDSQFPGVTSQDIVVHAMADATTSEAIRDDRYHDLGVGIARQKSGIESIYIIFAQQTNDSI